jgi:hypothetical protein
MISLKDIVLNFLLVDILFCLFVFLFCYPFFLIKKHDHFFPTKQQATRVKGHCTALKTFSNCANAAGVDSNPAELRSILQETTRTVAHLIRNTYQDYDTASVGSGVNTAAQVSCISIFAQL